eukprot:1143353-Prymnesium_polylepis.2
MAGSRLRYGFRKVRSCAVAMRALLGFALRQCSCSASQSSGRAIVVGDQPAMRGGSRSLLSTLGHALIRLRAVYYCHAAHICRSCRHCDAQARRARHFGAYACSCGRRARRGGVISQD